MRGGGLPRRDRGKLGGRSWLSPCSAAPWGQCAPRGRDPHRVRVLRCGVAPTPRAAAGMGPESQLPADRVCLVQRSGVPVPFP